MMPRLKITRSGMAASVSLAAVASYASFVRPRILRWGATAEEVSEAMPGDDIVGTPRYVTNHAVTIHAPAALVWPWLVQMGQGRGGLYSYDWLENLLGFDIHSADRIIPEFQHLQPGDTIRLVREGYPADLKYEVVIVDRERTLVLRTPGSPAENFAKNLPYGTWAFFLRKNGEETTRLIARTRSDFRPSVSGYIWNKCGLEPAHSIMERRMLLGIKARAEASVGTGGRGGVMVPVDVEPVEAA
ncbi:MAG: hypothetical protein ACYC4D_06835 [Thermoleophilia bacterium]